jgi:hypothetical protein
MVTFPPEQTFSTIHWLARRWFRPFVGEGRHESQEVRGLLGRDPTLVARNRGGYRAYSLRLPAYDRNLAPDMDRGATGKPLDRATVEVLVGETAP